MHIQKINEFLQSNEGNYLEIGIYYGETFFPIAKNNPNKKIYGIDPFISDGWTGQHKGTILTEAESFCEEKIKEYPNAKIFTTTSKLFLEQFLKEGDKFNVSIVFIDGSHWIDDVSIDTEIAVKLIGNKRGLIIYDDLDLSEVRRGIQEAIEKHSNLAAIEDLREYMGLGGIYTVNG